MQIGTIGLGRMGSNRVRRLLHKEHNCVVYDTRTEATNTLHSEGAVERIWSPAYPPRVQYG